MKQKLHQFFVVLIALFMYSSELQSQPSGVSTSLQVTTTYGVLEGTLEKSGIRSFKGIPFALPPVGDRRFKAPQIMSSWEGLREAKKFGPRAMQAPIFGDMGFRSDGMSEDCLYLNVWTPAKKATEKLPVLVYLYGGGYVAGDGSEARYDGESMATKGIVSLTVNYRLGAFGFLAHSLLSGESAEHASGNYGLLDQAAALKWVNENIAAFGGDPKMVTIAGESAGSASVSAQMASPLSKDLIAGAIGESGSLLGTLPAVPKEEAEKTGQQFTAKLGVQTLEELRKLPADSILNASMMFGVFRFSLNVDGYFFPKSPYDIFQNGEQAKVPLLAGWNSEESNHSAIMGKQPLTKENFNKAVKTLYGDKAEEILKVYAPASDAEVEQVADDLAGDRFIGFSTWKWTDVQVQTSKAPVYRYYYERPRPEMTPEMGNASAGLAGGVQKNEGKAKPPIPKGAVHSAEIEYAMGNLPYNKVYAWTADDYKVSKTMQDYFANFIKTGNPNGKGLPKWTALTAGKPAPVMHINVNTRLETEKNRERYLLLDR